MNFRTWWRWTNSIPWSERWFIYLILIRPVVDSFYYLKEISPFLSPLYWIGILTPIFCAPALLRKLKTTNTRENKIFNTWSVLVVAGSLLLFLQPFGFIENLQFFLRLTMPVYLFLFIRSFVVNRTNLIGVLTTFYYAVLISCIFMVNDAIISPKINLISSGRERIETTYADLFNYSIYISYGFLIISFFFLNKKNLGIRIKIWHITPLILFFIFILFEIGHFASYVVIAGLFILFLLQLIKKTSGETIVIGLFILVAVMLKGKDLYEEKIDPLVEREVEVLEGKRENSQMFHGRMARWDNAWASFKESNSVLAWLLGYSWSLKDSRFNVSIGIHNDYLRIFYLSGIIGSILYSMFLLFIWRKRKLASKYDRYLLTGSFLIILLYSVSSTPTLYPNILYVALTIFAFFSRPKSLIYAESKA
jgi:hypothetical protein